MRCLSLILCQAALFGFGTRGCASVLAPAVGKRPVADTVAPDPSAAGPRLWVPYLSEFGGAPEVVPSWLAVRGYFPGDDLQHQLAAAPALEEAPAGPVPAVDANGQAPDEGPGPVGAWARGGRLPPVGPRPNDKPPPPLDGVLSAREPLHLPNAVRLRARREGILLCESASQIFRPPRLPARATSSVVS